MFVVLTGCSSSSSISDPLNYEVKDFEFENQDGEIVSLNSLKGDIWLADFIFTNCDTVCPPMTAHMKELQNMIEAEGLEVKVISFSVDPENDTPDKIKEFASNYSINFNKWDFLTGYDQSVIEEFALKNFKVIVQKPKESEQVIHTSNFFLIDQNGVVMKDYSGVTDTPYDQIISDIKVLNSQE
ncbi:cytochrome c oxidase assembly protein [Bacillus weihaiensis]|uniref:Cytochrome c oxidase assembly protein n=2 Tax=Bacillus weihaiensis TaxID=1547283 RepID=A0A1L3MXK0_9BACI|nr:SCO family protein [Bacillus weihaiensis]APH07010.1 cytochrome c oxidase assembly protein [Bacillus weihaiensis]